MVPNFVLAGTYAQYRDWLGNRDPREFVYLSHVAPMVGVYGGKLWRVGTWYERDDAHLLLESASIRGIEPC